MSDNYTPTAAEVEIAAKLMWKERALGTTTPEYQWRGLAEEGRERLREHAREVLTVALAAHDAATEEMFKKAEAFDKAVSLSERRQTLLEEAEAECDAARAEIEYRIEDRDYWYGVATTAKDQRDAALAAIERAKSEHKSTGYWIGSGPGEVHEREPDGKLCLTCSDDDTGERLDNWEFDTSLAGWQSWPCPTAKALDGAPEPEVNELPETGNELRDEDGDLISSGEHRKVLHQGGYVCDTCTNVLGLNVRWDHADRMEGHPLPVEGENP